MNLILSILVAIFIAATICQSVIALGVSSSYEDYWPVFWKRLEIARAEAAKPSGLNPQKRKELEQLLWSNSELTETEKLVSEDWTASQQNVKGFDAKYRENVSKHANLVMDMSGYSTAITDYKSNLDRDRYFDQGKKYVGVDFNNLGIAYHLLATSTTEPKARAEAFAQALENLRLAEQEFRKINNNDALFINLANQYGLLQEMHDRKQAIEVFAKLQKVDTQPDKYIRDLVLEQQ